MTKKDICLIALVAVLGGWYVLHFTGWFRRESMRIQQTVRVVPPPGRAYGRESSNRDKPVENVSFSFSKDYRLTSVKLVVAAESRTNQHARPLWELVAPKGSQPVNGIAYGFPIVGMTPSVPGAAAQPLEHGVEYRLLVEARSVKGTNDFTLPGRPTSRRP